MAAHDFDSLLELRRFKRDQRTHQVIEAWKELLPEVNAQDIETLVYKFVQVGVTGQTLDKITMEIIHLDERDKNRVSMMMQNGFSPEQIHLFLHCNSQDRQALTSSWMPSAVERIKSGVARAANALPAALAITVAGGAIGALIFMAGGTAMGNPWAVEAGRVTLAILSDMPVGTDGADLMQRSVDSIIAGGGEIATSAAFGAFCLKGASTFIGELLKSSPQDIVKNARRDLEDRVMGAYERMDASLFQTPSGSIARGRAEQELSLIPDAYIPLFTHLTSQELIAFLVASDDGREQMMRNHPPGTDQRVDAIRSMHSSKMRRSWEVTRQALTMWDGFGSFGPGVKLSSTMTALRQARNAQRDTEDTAATRHGPAGLNPR